MSNQVAVSAAVSQGATSAVSGAAPDPGKPPSSQLVTGNKDVEASALERGKWTNPLDFVMSMVAFAVGLGNVWRFPYLAFKHGGGSFFVAYGFFFVCVAMPMMLMEAAMGQYMGLGATEIWKVFPILKGVGVANVILCFMVVAYYHVIICWAIFYLISSFAVEFPWEKCGHWWNTKGNTCIDGMMKDAEDHTQTAASEYFDRRVLNKSDMFENLGSIRWELLGIMLVLWVIIYFCIWRSLIKARYFVWFSAIFPYVILFSLLIRGLFLDGAFIGIREYVEPKLEKLLDPELWKDAGSQIFFSYGIGNGGIMSLSAYNHFNHNVVRDSIVTCFVNGGTSIIAGFAVFSTIGHMAHNLNLSMKEIDAKTGISGPGLGFKIYPEAVLNLPPKQLWAIGFFLMLCLLGLNSQVCLAEGCYSSIEDRFPKLLRTHKKKCLALYCLLTICISQVMITQAGILWLDVYDMYGAAGHSLLFVAFFEVVGIAWGFGAERVLQGLYEMRGSRSYYAWVILWKYLGPLAIGGTFIVSVICYGSMKQYLGLSFFPPVWVQVIAIFFSVCSMVLVPGYAIYYMLSKGPQQTVKQRFFEGITTPENVNKERVDKFSKIDPQQHGEVSVI